VPRKIFGPKRDELRGECRKLYDVEIHDLHHSPNITGVINSRIMSWEGHVTLLGERRCAYKVLIWKIE
jgi:hypothetical protein